MAHLVRLVAVWAIGVLGLVTIPFGALASADAGAEADFASRANGARAGRGLDGLSANSELTSVARRWSQRMANDNRLSHNSNLSNEVSQDWERLGENVGVGATVEDVHNAFMNSASHRANILDSGFTHLGVGVVTDASGSIWVTQVFMKLRGGGGSAPPDTSPPAPSPTTSTSRPRVATTSPPAATAPRAPRPAPATTIPQEAAPASPPAAEATTDPAVEPAPAAAASPTTRLVLVLEGLRALDRGL